MKLRMLAVILMFTFSASVVADSDNAAVSVWFDDGCWWTTADNLSVGNAHIVAVNNGIWTMSCSGEVVDGEIPDSATVLRSTSDNPLGGCSVGGLGSTQDWHLVVTPSGKSKFTCHGEVE